MFNYSDNGISSKIRSLELVGYWYKDLYLNVFEFDFDF